MTKQEMAFQIFLKRMPNERFNDQSRQGFESAAEQAMELAELFLESTAELVKLEGVPEDTL